MVDVLARNWWLLAIRGVAAILFGIGAFLWPGITIAVLVLLFGAYALVAGIVTGILTFMWPNITALVLLYFIAAWAIFTGVFEIAAAIRLRQEIEGEWMLILAGIASLIFGVLLFITPGAGALAVVWLIASYALLFGILLLVLAFRLRGMSDTNSRATMGAM
jgi:uncharacterized membrane protein HdeD (DUF308 family)